MRGRIGIVLVVILAIPLGCITVERDMQSWVGKHRSAVIAQFGVPTNEVEDGQGGSILIYEYTYEKVHGLDETTSVYGNTVQTKRDDITIIEKTQRRSFLVNEDGIVYDFAYQL
jgi:hypothetical protein